MRPYDPDNWLESLHHCLQDFTQEAFNDELVTVEMSFPDTTEISKETPLDKILVHFEQDDDDDRPLGFGTPGVEVFDAGTGTVKLHEAKQHFVNFDVGVWVSAQCGGSTGRMRTVQALKDLFGVAGSKLTMREATGGLYPQSFAGGRFHLDRVNDLPIWRAMQMTLIVQCFSRHIPTDPTPAIIDGFTLDDNKMTIDGDVPVTTEPLTR